MVYTETEAFIPEVGVDSAGVERSTVGFEFRSLDTRLPQPLSDFTAVQDEATGLVYIAGGCNSPKGNEYFADFDFYGCVSISNKIYVFDETASNFTTLPDMPRQRYRHAAAVVNSQLWLVGGRDVTDTLVSEVDVSHLVEGIVSFVCLLTILQVYDFGSGQWSFFTDLAEEFWMSDLTGFAKDGFAYFAGGYNAEYTAQKTVFSIDVAESSVQGQLSVQFRAPMQHARGDVSSVVSNDGTFAMVVGGFTHENDFCEPLGVAEKYTFVDELWTDVAPLGSSRSDKALVDLNGSIFALGGETSYEGYCDIPEPPRPGELIEAIDDIEIYDPEENQWEVLDKLPEHRFRFAAVGYDDIESIYVFGGQLAYQEDCQCFPASNEIVVLSESGGSMMASSFLAIACTCVLSISLAWL